MIIGAVVLDDDLAQLHIGLMCSLSNGIDFNEHTHVGLERARVNNLSPQCFNFLLVEQMGRIPVPVQSEPDLNCQFLHWLLVLE